MSQRDATFGLPKEAVISSSATPAQGEATTTDEDERFSLHPELDASRLEFLRKLGHEIRSPLYTAIGLLDSLRDEKLSPRARERIAHIAEALGQVRFQFEDLVDLAVLQRGEFRVNPAPVKIVPMLEAVTERFHAEAELKNLQFFANVSGPQRPILVDGRRVAQIVTHLLSYAIKRTHTGTVSVTANTTPAEASEQGTPRVWLDIVVSDTGMGMTPGEVERALEPFVERADQGGRDYQGVNVGLALARQILSRMNGDVQVQSEPGRGTRVSVRLLAELCVPAPAAGEGRRLLLVDDNEVNRTVGRLLLETLGHEVEVAEGGQAAIEAVRRREFDAVFMDVEMPGVDGLAATEAIRAEEQRGVRLPIIALTAHGFVEDELRCRRAGMDGYVTKPANADDLAEALRRVARMLPPTPHGPHDG